MANDCGIDNGLRFAGPSGLVAALHSHPLLCELSPRAVATFPVRASLIGGLANVREYGAVAA
jgi:hypothetical protein